MLPGVTFSARTGVDRTASASRAILVFMFVSFLLRVMKKKFDQFPG
jgi:hypothetical protein